MDIISPLILSSADHSNDEISELLDKAKKLCKKFGATKDSPTQRGNRVLKN